MGAKKMTQKEVNAEARAIVKALTRASLLHANYGTRDTWRLQVRARRLRPYLKETGR